MELEKAQKIANEIKQSLNSHCWKVQVAGSVRRQRPVVEDIDFVLVPKERYMVDIILMGLGKLKMSGFHLSRVQTDSIPLDIYFATPETFATLLLIRTGSVESNIRLCAAAKRRGWRLRADGSGLFNEKGERIAGDSERSIYKALRLVYQEPWDRG